MVYLWYTYGIPMVYLWYTYGIPMVYLWYTYRYGIPMGPMVYLWYIPKHPNGKTTALSSSKSSSTGTTSRKHSAQHFR